MTTFHWYGYAGGSGTIRGAQMAAHYGGDDCDGHGSGVHVYVKIEPPAKRPAHSYLDVIDGVERVPWLKRHPEVGVIAASRSEETYLRGVLGRDDIWFIPQHHCNYERARRGSGAIETAGVVGGRGAIRCNVKTLRRTLAGLGVAFHWCRHYANRLDVAEFYAKLDVQIVWRTEDRPWKNPLKLVNAMSFGIPTIAYPETAYQEVEGYYWPARTMADVVDAVAELRRGYDAERLIARAEEYHIEHVAKLYEALE